MVPLGLPNLKYRGRIYYIGYNILAGPSLNTIYQNGPRLEHYRTCLANIGFNSAQITNSSLDCSNYSKVTQDAFEV